MFQFILSTYFYYDNCEMLCHDVRRIWNNNSIAIIYETMENLQLLFNINVSLICYDHLLLA